MDAAAIIEISRAISMIGAIILDQMRKMPEADRPIPLEKFEAKLAAFKELADLPT
jgi:hypothetical protein